MSSSGKILPNPKWYFVNNNGTPLGAGYLYTYLQSNPTQFAPVYQDATETLAYTNPILIDANGTAGPLFFDSATNYYLVVTDNQDPPNTIWTMENFSAAIAGGSGGGGTITTAIDLENLIQNNTFYRNNLNGTGVETLTPVPLFATLAPGAHTSLAGDTANANGSPAPDICFIKNDSTAVDTLTFGNFTPGVNEFSPSDVTPQYYLNYTCTTAATGGELYKYVQFPITSGAQNLNNQPVVGKIWARWNSGSTALTINVRQFWGSGSMSSGDNFLGAITLTLNTDGLWHAYPLMFTMPNAAGQTPGQCGNDGVFFQVGYPLNLQCNIDFVKPSLYLGTLYPSVDFHTNDQIESIGNDFRTGDIRTSLNAFAPLGWVPANDGSIGSANSNVAAGSSASTRSNRDTFPLYNLLWNAITSQTNGTNAGGTGYAQLYTSSGVPIATVGATAVADFTANNRIGLTKTLGRLLATAGSGAGLTARTLGEYIGSEVITLSAMPLHNHPGSTVPIDNTVGGVAAGALGQLVKQTGGSTATLTITPQGGGTLNTQGAADGNMPPVTFMNVFFKL